MEGNLYGIPNSKTKKKQKINRLNCDYVDTLVLTFVTLFKILLISITIYSVGYFILCRGSYDSMAEFKSVFIPTLINGSIFSLNDWAEGWYLIALIASFVSMHYIIDDGDTYLESALNNGIYTIFSFVYETHQATPGLLRLITLPIYLIIIIPLAIYYIIVLAASCVLNAIFAVLNLIFNIDGILIFDILSRILNEAISLCALLIVSYRVYELLNYWHIIEKIVQIFS